jgi:hypothetical protein
MRVLRRGMNIWFFDNRWLGRATASCHFVHLILLSSGQKVLKLGPFKNEGIHEVGESCKYRLSSGERKKHSTNSVFDIR